MEHLLVIWIGTWSGQNIFISLVYIQFEILTFFQKLSGTEGIDLMLK